MNHASAVQGAAFIALVMAGAFAKPATACSCPRPDYEEKIREAEAVFQGKRLGWSIPEDQCLDAGFPDGSVELTFEVSKVFKGDLGSTTTLRTEATTCSFGLNENVDEYIVIARAGGCDLRASSCSGGATLEYAAINGLLEVLDRYEPDTNTFREAPETDGGVTDAGTVATDDDEDDGNDNEDEAPGCSHTSSGRASAALGVVSAAVVLSRRRKRRAAPPGRTRS